jgi:hypothetical protein
MSKSKIVGIVALIAFTMAILLVGNALAGERGKISSRNVYYSPTFHTLKVPDVEDHTIMLYEGKGISFTEKWGACLVYEAGIVDTIKGEGTCQGYTQYSFPDGSTTMQKWEGRLGAARNEGTWTYIKGTGKFNGIQGKGTWKASLMSPERWYSDGVGEYTLP